MSNAIRLNEKCIGEFYTQPYYNSLLSGREKIERMDEPEVCREYNTDSKQEILDILKNEIRLCEKKVEEGEIRLNL
ncbi:hypothetical protein EZS27_016959 [termite gut metagenome]|uniref:Uncharacterized protein n=1 Tax=termite gut metagenome TaxID=433724 RepID=A0A5J4RNV7_9ZZZZ